MKTSSRITSLLLVLLLALPMISAELVVQTFTHEAEFNAAEHITKVCGCGSTTDYFVLENRGDFPATFALSLDSEASWISLNERMLALEPGQQVPVEVVVRPPCGTETDTEYKVFATSEFGRYRAADRQLGVITCQPIRLEVQGPAEDLLPCTPANYDLRITNTASYTETYRISADPSAHVTLSANEVTLIPGESTTVSAVAQWPCDVFGQRRVVFTVDAINTDISQSHVDDLNILWDYGFTMEGFAEPTVCAQVQHQIPILIRNAGSVDNSYDLMVDADWASLEKESIDIRAGGSATVMLRISPEEMHVGDQEVVVEAQARTGGATQQLRVPVNIEDCYEHQVELTPSELSACAGPANVSVQVRNRGLSVERFMIESDGDIFSQPVREEIELRPGEHQDVMLESLIPDRTRDYDIIVRVNQTPGVVSETLLPVHATSNADCTLIEPTTTELEVFTDVSVVPVIVENKGVRSSVYDVRWNGTLFSVDEERIFLAPGEQAVLHLRATDAAAQQTGDFIERLFLTSSRAEYRYDFSVDLERKGFFDRAYERIAFGDMGGVDWCLVAMIILIIIDIIALLVLLAAYAGMLPLWQPENAKVIALVLLVLGAIFLVIGAFVAADVQIPRGLAEEPRGSSYPELYHEVAQGEMYELDLSRYFTDPDDDRLTFTASQSSEAEVLIRDDTAIIKPARGFTGSMPLVFTAEDERGATADSPIITLRVLRLEDVSVWTKIGAFCSAINWFLLAVLMLIAALYFVTKPDKELEKRYGQPVREMIIRPSGAVVTTERVPTETTTMAPVGSPTVMGDVVAGDKVTMMGAPKKEVFIASDSGTKIHRAECSVGQRIPREKRKVYSSREDALRAGYNPCRVCRPFDE